MATEDDEEVLSAEWFAEPSVDLFDRTHELLAE